MQWTPAIVAISVAVFLGIAGGFLTEIGPWYRSLRKPRLKPPDWLFGPAWTIILGLAAWSAIVSWAAASSPEEQFRVVALFGVNAVLHFLWSPIFFRLKRPDLALFEVALLWASLVALVIGLSSISRLGSVLVSPYLLWVTFAMWLNWQIVRLNPRTDRPNWPRF